MAWDWSAGGLTSCQEAPPSVVRRIVALEPATQAVRPLTAASPRKREVEPVADGAQEYAGRGLAAGVSGSALAVGSGRLARAMPPRATSAPIATRPGRWRARVRRAGRRMRSVRMAPDASRAAAAAPVLADGSARSRLSGALRASRIGTSLASASASSASGCDPATMPQPAKSRSRAPSVGSISAQRKAIPHSPSPVASSQPTGPA